MSDKFAGGIKAGSTSVSLPVILRKAADNTEQTGILAASVNGTYRRQGQGSVTISSSDLSSITSAWTAGGWKETDATNRPGEYRFDLPDAAFAPGADFVVIAVKVAGCYMFFERFALESKGAAEVSAQIAGGVPLGAPDSQVVHSGTAQGGASQSITLASGASAIDGTYVGSRVKVSSGTGAGQTRVINSYTGATKVATVSRVWTTNPDATSIYAIVSDDAIAPNAGLQSTAILASSGLDAIVVEAGVNARQALSPILAACAGVLSGATTTSVSIAAANNPATNRITATVDSSGNRSAVSLNLPS